MVRMSAEPSPGIDGIPDERLAAELDRLGVHFIRAHAISEGHIPISPTTLLAALACSREARMQLALIPLLLVRPEFASAAGDAASRLAGFPRLTLACYYTAAMLLQRKHETRLRVFGFGQERLPDIFGRELGVSPSTDVDQSLRLLAHRQAVLSGRSLNWYGTYEHAAERLLRQAELEVRWTPT